MRAAAIFSAFVLVAAPFAVAPVAAHADGIERPHPILHRHLRPHRVPPLAGPPVVSPAVVHEGSETVTLQPAFFAYGGGGVGVDIATTSVSSSTVIISGGRGGTARAFAFASASASAGAGAHVGGEHGGHGCGCR